VQLDLAHIGKVVFFGETVSADVGDAEGLCL